MGLEFLWEWVIYKHVAPTALGFNSKFPPGQQQQSMTERPKRTRRPGLCSEGKPETVTPFESGRCIKNHRRSILNFAGD
jgi:hypothetical protein